jgi:dienelactone hydrolase
VLALVLVAAGCGGSAHRTVTKVAAPSPFAYDAGRPLDVRIGKRLNRASYPIAIRDVSYAIPGGRVQAYLAVPPRRGRLPAVVYLHGAGGDRLELLVPATWIAARAAVAMTLTLPSATAGPPPSGSTPSQSLEWQRAQSVADVVAVRRAVDLLSRRADVDPARIGLVGWSYGGKVGAVLVGAEPRIRAFVLDSAGAVPVSAYVRVAPAALKAEFRRVLTAIDPLRWIARGRPGTVLLQDGRKDTVVPMAALQAVAHAAPRGTVVRWYPGGHAPTNAAEREQLDWLVRKLGIRGPAVAGAETGP